MKVVAADPKVMSVVEIEKMSDKLKKAYNLLEVIQKGLNAVTSHQFSTSKPITIKIFSLR